MSKYFTHETKMVKFLSTDGTESDYNVFDRPTHEDHRIRHNNKTDDIRGVGREATDEERRAIKAYLVNKRVEYLAWQTNWNATHSEDMQIQA